MDGPNIIGLSDVTGGGAISLEPGGQFELSGAPVATIHRTCSELMAHLAQLPPDSPSHRLHGERDPQLLDHARPRRRSRDGLPRCRSVHHVEAELADGGHVGRMMR